MFKINLFVVRFIGCLAEGNAMRNSQDRKDKTRQRILKTAARLFSRNGFSDITIGEIMIAAGLTHGGFYRHFTSKGELYAEAVRHFLRKETPEPWQKNSGDACRTDQPFARTIVDAYLSRDHLDDLDGSCPLIGLPSDVARSSPFVKAAYLEVAESMIRVFESNLSEPDAHQQALVLLRYALGPWSWPELSTISFWAMTSATRRCVMLSRQRDGAKAEVVVSCVGASSRTQRDHRRAERASVLGAPAGPIRAAAGVGVARLTLKVSAFGASRQFTALHSLTVFGC